jgi:hypothetical protein
MHFMKTKPDTQTKPHTHALQRDLTEAKLSKALPTKKNLQFFFESHSAVAFSSTNYQKVKVNQYTKLNH